MKPYPAKRSGYTLVEVIGVVVIAAILLAAVVPSVAQALRVRVAEATLKHDLHNAANHYEQAYLSERRYPENLELRLSPEIAVDSQAVLGERVYVRLRHVPSGQLCALDYSRSSSVARNRADCYRGGQARDTALTVTVEPPPAPPADTFAIVLPPGPPPPENPLALANPGVEGGGDQADQPGASMASGFTVTNRSSVARAFRFEVGSSNPAVVPSVLLEPGTRVLEPNVPTWIPITYVVSEDARADESSVIPLRVEDAGDDRWAATGTFTFVTEAALRDPAVSVVGSSERVEEAGRPFDLSWTVTNRSNAARMLALALSATEGHVEVVDDGGIGRVPFTPGQARTVTVRVQITAGSDGGTRSGVSLTAIDADAPVHQGAATADVETRTVVAAPTVTPPAALGADPGEVVTLTWIVRNESNQARHFEMTPAVADSDYLEVVASDCMGDHVLRRGEVHSISVTYRVSDRAVAGRSSEAYLQVVDRDAPEYEATGTTLVRTHLVLARPSWIALPTSPMFWEVGEERTLDFTFRNESNDTRTFCVATSSESPSQIVVVTSSPVCGIRVASRETFRLPQALRAAAAGSGLKVTAVVYDAESPSLHADTFVYKVVRETLPIAVWEAPQPVYVRRWATFDGARSWSPAGSPIVRYIWTWGLFLQRWDPVEARFVYNGEWGTASDEVEAPSVARAYDLQGSFLVCLTVIDAGGRRSDPNCQSITTHRPTVARLAWRYRGWWTHQDFCLDVWWDSQCDAEHGNGRWEIDLRPSLGDVRIKAATAAIRVKLHNTDDPDRPATVTYAGNAGTIPAWSAYAFSRDVPHAVGKAQEGMWRVLSTTGTAVAGWPVAPNVMDHALVLNINLAAATGFLDGGPHWVPDDVWITLNIQDEHDRWTSVTAYRDHDKGNWRRGYDTAVVAAAPPTVSVNVENLGGGRYLARGTGESAEGRIAERSWEVTVADIWSGESYSWTTRDETVELRPEPCQRITVALTVKDDLGAFATGIGVAAGAGGRECFGPAGEIVQQAGL